MNKIKSLIYPSLISSSIILGGCSFNSLGKSITNSLFKRKEETRQIMAEAFKEALFGKSKTENKFSSETPLKYLSKDGDYCLEKGDSYSALRAYTLSKDVLGIEAAAIVSRDKNNFREYMKIRESMRNGGIELNDARGYLNAMRRGYTFSKPRNFFLSLEKENYEQDYFSTPFCVADQTENMCNQSTTTLETMFNQISDKSFILLEDVTISAGCKKNMIKIIKKTGSNKDIFLSDILYQNDSINEYNSGLINEEQLFEKQGFYGHWLNYLDKLEYDSLFSELRNRGINIFGVKKKGFKEEPLKHDIYLMNKSKELLENAEKVYIGTQVSRTSLQHLPLLFEKEDLNFSIISQMVSTESRYNQLENLLKNTDNVLKVGDNWYMFNEININEANIYLKIKEKGERKIPEKINMSQANKDVISSKYSKLNPSNSHNIQKKHDENLDISDLPDNTAETLIVAPLKAITSILSISNNTITPLDTLNSKK